jgi:uncharacterized protein YceH (UPF0502 family)
MKLTLIETRVLACLVEKSMTTPEYYPLTLNALVAACNQKSNRDPLMQVSEADVLGALDTLKEKKLAWSVALAGSRVAKYRHGFLEVCPVTPAQLAILCELMLRGPQTAGELKLRASRMAPLSDGDQVHTLLHELAAWSGGALLRRLSRQPGQREERYAHLLGEEASPAGNESPSLPEASGGAADARPDWAALEGRVVAVEDELARLRAQFADFMKQFQ